MSGADQPMAEAGQASADASTKESAPPTAQDNVKAAEKAALNIQKKVTTHALPIRQYLETTVVPPLMQGLQSLCKERPEDPVEYLANYLLEHSQRKKAQQAGASGSAAATTVKPEGS